MQNKTVLITGSASGIGRAVAEALLEEGYDLVVHYYTGHRGIREMKRRAQRPGRILKAIHADFSKAAQLRACVREIRTLRMLSAVIHCAGMNEKKAFERITERDYQRVFDVNIRAPLFITQALLSAHALKNRGTSVVFVGSPNGFIGGGKRNTLYTSSKMSLIGLTRNLAKELAPNVRVNCIVPGFTKTQMLYGHTGTKELNYKRSLVPTARFAEPEEIAQAIVFLISEKAAYITGQTIHVNGGLYFN